uniref:Macro domain-containing protein n=1 Tax=Poecilia latipinna TaxID=48699 RepID=A0A3B3VCY6_9TELE
QVLSLNPGWTLNYITGNLFSCPWDESLAHCISEDCRMGAGIAVMFKKKFGRVSELKEQSEGWGCLSTCPFCSLPQSALLVNFLFIYLFFFCIIIFKTLF